MGRQPAAVPRHFRTYHIYPPETKRGGTHLRFFGLLGQANGLAKVGHPARDESLELRRLLVRAFTDKRLDVRELSEAWAIEIPVGGEGATIENGFSLLVASPAANAEKTFRGTRPLETAPRNVKIVLTFKHPCARFPPRAA